MDYSELTNKQLRKRIKLLRKLRDLETTPTSKSDGSKSDLWVPDARNWLEHDPFNGTLDQAVRSKSQIFSIVKKEKIRYLTQVRLM